MRPKGRLILCHRLSDMLNSTASLKNLSEFCDYIHFFILLVIVPLCKFLLFLSPGCFIIAILFFPVANGYESAYGLSSGHIIDLLDILRYYLSMTSPLPSSSEIGHSVGAQFHTVLLFGFTPSAHALIVVNINKLSSFCVTYYALAYRFEICFKIFSVPFVR